MASAPDPRRFCRRPEPDVYGMLSFSLDAGSRNQRRANVASGEELNRIDDVGGQSEHHVCAADYHRYIGER